MFQKIWGDFKVNSISWCFCSNSYQQMFPKPWLQANMISCGATVATTRPGNRHPICRRPWLHSPKACSESQRWTIPEKLNPPTNQPTNQRGIKSKRLKIWVLWKREKLWNTKQMFFENEEKNINNLSRLLVNSSLALSQPGRIIRIDIEGVCLWIVRQDKTSRLQALEDKKIFISKKNLHSRNQTCPLKTDHLKKEISCSNHQFLGDTPIFQGM